MRKATLHHQQKGFTLVELMIATAVYAVVLLIALQGITQVGRMYYRGLSAARTQEVARDIIDDVSRAVQFSGSSIQQNGANTICIGTQRYTFVLNKRLVDATPANTREANHVLQKDTPGSGATGCPIAANQAALQNPVELVSSSMRLSKFVVTEVAGSNQRLYNVTVKVVYGEDDLLSGLNLTTGDSSNAQCAGGTFLGGQFCAVSEFSTIVYKRVQ